MIRRRAFITLLGGAVAAWPLAARAQQGGKVARVGFLGNDLDNSVTAALGYKAFASELQKLGFTEGRNLVLEYRRVDEGIPKAFAAANELAAGRAEVLVANGTELALQAAAVHYAARRHGSNVARGGAGAAAEAVGYRLPGRDHSCGRATKDRCLRAAAQRAWLDRRP